jgi:flagellar biosynthetic protein FliP
MKFVTRWSSRRLVIFSLRALCVGMILVGSAHADSLTLDLGQAHGSIMGRLAQLLMIVSVLAVAPSILIVATSFTRFTIVFSFLRTAMGTQQSPPNMILVSLALFLSGYVMAPTLEDAYKHGVLPLVNQTLTEEEALPKITRPFHQFMAQNVREKDLELFMNLSAVSELKSRDDIPLKILLPAFVISELRRSFEIGFLVFLPFVIIDLVVASLLMAMGMMMLPPALISLPFKIIFFVLVDGWHLLCGSLVNSFVGD